MGIDGLLGSQFQHRPLDPPAHGAGHMADGGAAAAAGQHEFLQRRQVFVIEVDGLFKFGHGRFANEGAGRDRELATEVEQVVLDVEKQFGQSAAQRLGQQHAEVAIQLIDLADGMHARLGLGNPRAVAEAGGAGIAGAGINFGKAMSHGGGPVRE